MTRPRFDKGIRNLIEMAENPAAKLVRQFEDSPTVQLARMLERYDVSNSLMAAIRQANVSFESHVNSPQWPEFSALIEAARRNRANSEIFDSLHRITQNLRNSVLSDNPAILPGTDALQALSVSAAHAIQPIHSHFAEPERWPSTIAQRMATLTSPWAMKDYLGVSVVGFSRIARLHDLSTGTDPFDLETSEIFGEELGRPVAFATDAEPDDRESAAMDAGLNPEIVAFPTQIYPKVLLSAGFEFSIERIRDVQSDSGDKSGVFDPQHAILLQQVEHHLRMAVEAKLLRLVGESWYRSRVPGQIWHRWRDRKEEDRQRRGDSYRLIFYADFTDLSQIICRKDNWNDAFHPLFVSKDDIQISMQRLSPIRNAISHSRPLVRTDQIILFSEAFRILTALGVLTAQVQV